MAAHGLLAAALAAAALTLAACGRKGGLDAPPLAAGEPPQGAPGGSAQPQALGPDGKPLPPPPAEKPRVPFLDWLID